jgi:hypothetical protein
MSAGAALPVNWDGKFGDVTVARDTAVYRSDRLRCASLGRPGKVARRFSSSKRARVKPTPFPAG